MQKLLEFALHDEKDKITCMDSRILCYYISVTAHYSEGSNTPKVHYSDGSLFRRAVILKVR